MALTTDQQLISDFWRCFSDTDETGITALMHPEISWQAMGRQGGLPISGVMDKAAILSLMHNVRQMSVSGLALTMVAWTGESERIAVEMEGKANMQNGRDYYNHYHFLAIIHDSKIHTLREYGDTDEIRRVFLT